MNRFGKLNVILLLAIIIIFTSCKKKNNNTVVASSLLTTTNNNIKIANLREVPNENVEENEKTNVKNINDLNVAISTLSTSKNKNQSKGNDILSKFFKTSKDKDNVRTIIKDFNDEKIEKIYNDIKNGKYKNTINSFIDKNDKLFDDFKNEFSKNKYVNYYKELKKYLNDNKYNNIRTEISKVTKKYISETKEITKLYEEYKFKQLLSNLNKGKYNNLIEDLKAIILKEEYDSIFHELNNKIIDGELTDMFYDVIYNSLEIIYKYDEDKFIVEETIEEVIETTETVKVENEKETRLFPIVPVALFIFFILIAFLIIFITRKKDEGGE